LLATETHPTLWPAITVFEVGFCPNPAVWY
jgi:hypothetical protein